MTTSKHMKNRRSPRRGHAAMMVGLLIPVEVGSVAMAVDFSRMYTTENYLQFAIDAATLAATEHVGSQQDAFEVANAYANEFVLNGSAIDIDINSVKVGYWDGADIVQDTDEDYNAVVLTGTATSEFLFASMFGLEEITVSAISGASPNAVGKKAPDMVLALDVTGSMSHSEVAQEKAAAQALLDCIWDRSDRNSHLGITVFTGVDTKVLDMTHVADNYGTISAAIDSVGRCNTSGMPSCSTSTNHAAGMGGALRTLEAWAAVDREAILLMSDGEPWTAEICQSQYYTGDGWAEYELPDLCAGEEEEVCEIVEDCDTVQNDCGWEEYCRTNRRGRTRCRDFWVCDYEEVCTEEEQCEMVSSANDEPTLQDYQDWANAYQLRAVGQEIDIYTVFYGTDNSDSQYLADNVMAGEDAFHLEVPSATQMYTAFEEVCQSVINSDAGLIL